MSTRAAARQRFVLILCSVIAGNACDLVARSGETLMLGGNGTVFGTGGNAQTPPGSAVTVQPGGTVIVQDANVLGGGILVEQVGQPKYGRSGAGILAPNGGATIRVEQGVVAGGSVVLQVAVTSGSIDQPFSGISATNSSIEVSGGTIRGGALISQVGAFPPSTVSSPVPGLAIQTFGGTLRVTGGTFLAGVMDPVDPAVVRISGWVDGTQSEIRGGTFSDMFVFGDGRARIFGGTFDVLAFINFDPSSCSELRGGMLNRLAVFNGRVIVAGTGFVRTPLEPPLSILTGTLENGQRLGIVLVEDNGGAVQLVPPGALGCS